jgi:hypothetical protein
MSKVKIQGNASGTGVVTLTAPNTNTDRTITLPDSTGSILMADGDGSALTNLPGGGKVLQVVTGTYSTETSSTSTTYADTGLSATITPSSTSSKILVFGSNNGGAKKSGDGYGDLQLLRGTTSLYVPHTRYGYTSSNAWVYGFSLSFHYLDSPSTTSATTYKTQFKSVVADGTAVRVQDNASVSTITLIEIGA